MWKYEWVKTRIAEMYHLVQIVQWTVQSVQYTRKLWLILARLQEGLFSFVCVYPSPPTHTHFA